MRLLATIKTAIQLYDRASPVLRSMVKVMRNTTEQFMAIERASKRSVDTSKIKESVEALKQMDAQLDEIEKDLDRNKQSSDNFASSIGRLAGGIGAAFGAKKIIELADATTQTTSRLNMLTGSLEETEELQNKIMASANRSRASYQSTADAIGKMGVMAKDAFSSNDELIAFTELINKQFTIAGTSQQGMEAAMLQLTQAMSSGVLRGEELNSIFEQAPTIIQSVADYLDVPIGKIRGMAEDGKITAEIVKNAMFSQADAIDEKFSSMPYTFSQVWTTILNVLYEAFMPVIQAIGSAADWIATNWDRISPIFYGIAAAVGVLAVAFGIWKLVTLAQTIAQWALNSALLASPITWIVLAIALVVGALVVWIKKIGGLRVAWLIVVNAILTAWDWVKIAFKVGVNWVVGLFEKMQLGFKSVGTKIANFMGDMKANVLMLLQNLVNGAIGIINKFIGVLNKIPGVSINTIAEVEFGTRAQLENEAAKAARNAELENFRSEIEANAAERDATVEAMRTEAADARAERLAEIEDARAKAAEEDSAFSVANTLESLGLDTADIAGNTAKMADSMDELTDDISYMKDIAEKEAVNRYVMIEGVNITNNNNIASDMDIDGVMDKWNEDFIEVLETAAEGVHG